MTRTTARELAIQLSFAITTAKADPEEAAEQFFNEEYFTSLAEEDELYAEYPRGKYMDYIIRLATGVVAHRLELDSYIEKYSKGWKASRISKTALAVMRAAIFEILYFEDVPAGAAIDEAVELSKGYEDAETVSFINGVLGGFVRGELGQAPDENIQQDELGE